jgi:hypothetical protein
LHNARNFLIWFGSNGVAHESAAIFQVTSGLKGRIKEMKKSGSNPMVSKVLPAIIALAGFGGLGAVYIPVAMAQDSGNSVQDAGGQRTDGQIEMDVVHALDAAPELKQDWITAGTVQGEVTLSGTSASDANRQLSESIASKVPGVTKVVNNLKVGDPQQAQSAEDVPQDAAPEQAQQNPDQGQPSPSQPQSAYDNGQQPNAPPQPGYQPAPRGNYPAEQEQPRGPVTLAQGTLLKVRTSEPLDSKKAKDGAPVEFTVVRDVYAGGVLAIPRGATVRGQVVDVKKSGALGGSPELALKLDSLDLGGQSYALASDPFSVKGPNKAGRTVGNAFGGAVLGAIIGGAVGGGEGAAIGAGAGAVGGTAATAATPSPHVWIPAEALMDFHLNAPLTVNPVSMQEARRLAGNVPPPSQRPTLYRRGYYPYGYPPPPPPPGYYGPY